MMYRYEKFVANWHPDTCSSRTNRSVLNEFANGLQTAPFVREIEGLEDVRERGVPAADSRHRRLQIKKAAVLKRLVCVGEKNDRRRT